IYYSRIELINHDFIIKQIIKWGKQIMDLLYRCPNMDAIEKRQDIVYKEINEKLLKLDVYYSNNNNLTKIPTVIVVHGSSSIEDIKDIKLFQSWGKVLAASGFNTVVFNWRPEEN